MTLAFAVLGDSIGYGMGASRPADTLGPRLAATLAASGIPIHTRVFAVSGACSDAADGQARQATAWGAGVALIVIGANDLTHFVPPQVAAEQLGVAVRTLRAGGAQVVVCPAPDLSVVPWVPPQMRLMVRAASTLMRAAQVRVATADGARVVDAVAAMSTTFAVDPTLFSSDRFHPSSAGYALIAAALAPTVVSAAATWGARGQLGVRLRRAGPALIQHQVVPLLSVISPGIDGCARLGPFGCGDLVRVVGIKAKRAGCSKLSP